MLLLLSVPVAERGMELRALVVLCFSLPSLPFPNVRDGHGKTGGFVALLFLFYIVRRFGSSFSA